VVAGLPADALLQVAALRLGVALGRSLALAGRARRAHGRG
jgi:hypothetical protein